MNSPKQQLDILLISPPIFYESGDSIWREINSNFPPLGLASLAGHVRSKNYNVRIVDCNIESPSVDLFEDFFKKEYVGKYGEIKYFGITSMTCTIKKAYKIAEICKRYFPEAKVIFGGVHSTFMYAEVLKHDVIDIVSIAEGEITLEEILDGKPLNEIAGIAYKESTILPLPEGEWSDRVEGEGEPLPEGERGKNENSSLSKMVYDGQDVLEPTHQEKTKIKVTIPRDRIMNLDEIAMPAYDLLPVLKYKPAKGSYKRLPAMAMMTSRGCPGRCTFCSKTLGLRLVFKSAEKILEEIKFLIDNYGIKQIMFYDDTFTVFKKNVEKLCDMIVEQKIDISWTCFARVDFIDEELLSKMKKAGCHQIMYGVENIDEGVLKNIKKRINLPQVENAVKWTKNAGIECRVAFMVGNPGDNREVIMRNVKFVNKIDPDLLVVNITTPFPGTEMFKWAKERDLLLSYNWDDYDLAKPVMKLENLTVDEIKDLYKLMYRKFYFRPSFIIKKILSIRSLDDIKIYLDGFKALVSFAFKKKKT